MNVKIWKTTAVSLSKPLLRGKPRAFPWHSVVQECLVVKERVMFVIVKEYRLCVGLGYLSVSGL